jgi:site-specific DNA-adenine methylase
MEKTYSQAPLPFVGQKRMFASEFRKILKRFSDKTVFIDLFGGSGLLSHITKRERPDATVIYNDHDNYRERLENIHRTNELLKDLRETARGYPRHKKITGCMRDVFLERILQDERNGFVDYLTLSSSLLFYMKYVLNFEELKKQNLYNKLRQNDYSCDGYLDGLEVVCCDYKELADKYNADTDVVFLVDPPYMATDISTYKMDWRLQDYLDVLLVLSGHPFVYFTSGKSPILDFCEWMEQHPDIGNPFRGTGKSTLTARMNYNSSYTDIMLYKETTDAA